LREDDAPSSTMGDRDPAMLGVQNGVIHLPTGRLQPSRREDWITLLAGIPYDPDARSDRWEHALKTILPDEALRNFFQVAIGYAATGDTREDCWFLTSGSGRNGKGTLLLPIRRALGDYALELPGSIFNLRTERSPYELAYLPGRRFVTSSESGDTLHLHHDRIKQLTGGDSMSASNKYEEGVSIQSGLQALAVVQ
jgi:putative DNA primase/helicase